MRLTIMLLVAWILHAATTQVRGCGGWQVIVRVQGGVCPESTLYVHNIGIVKRQGNDTLCIQGLGIIRQGAYLGWIVE